MRILCLWAIFLVSSFAWGEGAERQVIIRWQPVKKAMSYEVEVFKTNEAKDALITERVEKNRLRVKLKPGDYFYRIRGYDKEGNPGPWSDLDGIKITPPAVKLVSPKNRKIYRKEIGTSGIEFNWREVEGIDEYLLQISDKRGIVSTERVSGTNFEYLPPRSGQYYWRVGFEVGPKTKWSKRRTFLAKKSSLKGTKRRKESLFDIRVNYIQSYYSISIVDQAGTPGDFDLPPLGSSANPNSSSGLSGGVGFDLGWRLPRYSKGAWRLFGSLHFQADRRIIENRDLFYPNAFIRVGVSTAVGDHDDWDFGPFAQFGIATGVMVPLVRDHLFTDDREDGGGVDGTGINRVSRLRPGIGGVFKHRASESIQWQGYLLLRYDIGGTHPNYGFNIDPSFGFELGFSFGYFFSSLISLDLGVRISPESLSWTGQDLFDSSTVSGSTDTLLMGGDVGIRFHF